MPVPSLAVANFFVQKSLDTGIELTPMKVIKMVYIAHGWHLAIKNEPLIDEAVEAWKYGPVITSVYEEFRSYRNQQIIQMAKFISNGEIIYPAIEDPKTINLLEKVWEGYSKYDGLQLSTISHEDGSPWSITWHSHGKKSGYPVIPNEIIRRHYRKLIGDRKIKSAS